MSQSKYQKTSWNAGKRKDPVAVGLTLNPKECLAFDFSSQCHPLIKHERHENKGNDHLLKRLSIYKRILLLSNLGNV